MNIIIEEKSIFDRDDSFGWSVGYGDGGGYIDGSGVGHGVGYGAGWGEGTGDCWCNDTGIIKDYYYGEGNGAGCYIGYGGKGIKVEC